MSACIEINETVTKSQSNTQRSAKFLIFTYLELNANETIMRNDSCVIFFFIEESFQVFSVKAPTKTTLHRA